MSLFVVVVVLVLQYTAANGGNNETSVPTYVEASSNETSTVLNTSTSMMSNETWNTTNYFEGNETVIIEGNYTDTNYSTKRIVSTTPETPTTTTTDNSGMEMMKALLSLQCNYRGFHKGCQCDDGYTGIYCETKIEFCEQLIDPSFYHDKSYNPTWTEFCKQQKAECIELDGMGPQCKCMDGTFGKVCEPHYLFYDNRDYFSDLYEEERGMYQIEKLG